MAKKLDQDYVWASQEEKLPSREEEQARQGDMTLLPLSREERARMLAQDPNYPSEEIIKALAEMLARHWYS